MHNFGWAKVAVFYGFEDPYARFYREVFEHAGIPFEEITEVSAREITRFHVLVLCGRAVLHEAQIISLTEWVKKGGQLICSGSAWGAESLLGLEREGRHAARGVVRAKGSDRIWPEHASHARFFGGELKNATLCEVIAQLDGDYVGISRMGHGKGLAIYLAPHVGQTIRLMQTGKSVECDIVGPADGSTMLDDGVLRAEDGTALDFEQDRSKIEGCDTPFFAYPHCDVLREIVIRAVLYCVDNRELSVPLMWHWPHGAIAAGMLTIDCEEYDRDHVNAFYRLLAMFGMPAAWLVGMPGYPLDVYRAMRAWGHEVGLLFHSEGDKGWHEEKMKIQLTAVGRLTAQPNLVSARAQDGRWKGWTHFYDLCEQAGARVSLSKGGRQPGTSGFLFGTSHPFVPARGDGSHFLVTEIPYTAYNPGLATPDPVAEKIVYQTAARYGCFHMVCQSSAIKHNITTASLRRILSIAKQQRLEFMIPEDVHRFERGRRQLRITQKLLDTEGTLLFSSDVPLDGLTIMVNGPRLRAEMKGKDIHTQVVERYGTKFNMVTLNLEAKQQTELRLSPDVYVRAA